MKFKNQVSVVSPVNGEHATNKEYVDSKQKTISWADYQALSDEEQKNGTLYNIPDMPTTEPSETLNLYSRLAQIGLSGGNTIQEVFNALPEASVLEIGVSEYGEVTDKTVKYGVFAVAKAKLGTKDIFDENGKAISEAIVAEISEYNFVSVELKITGFTDEKKDAKLAMGMYVSVTDEEYTEYSYLQNGTPSENEKYFFISYNDVVKKPSTDEEVA